MKSKVLTILLSFAISFGLWLYVITVERTQIEYTFYNVPVVMDGESVLEDRGLMITSSKERTVNLTLSGKRSDLNKLKSSDITVLVDLTRIYEAGEKDLPYTVSFPGNVQNSAIEIVKRQPDNIKLTVAQWATKEIPVQIAIMGTPAEGYRVDQENISATPKTVGITGPKELIDKIAIGKITVDMEDAKESYEQRQRVTLCDAAGNPVEDDLSKVFVDNHMILVKVPLLMEKEIKLDFDIIPGGGLTAADVKISMGFNPEKLSDGPAVITVIGSPSAVSKLPDTIKLDSKDLSKYMTGESGLEYAIPVPEGITVVQGDTVYVSWEFASKTYTNSIRVSSMQFEIVGNVPAGKTVEFKTQSLLITLRSTDPVIEKLRASDIKVIVDLTNVTDFREPIPVKVEVEGDNVGIMSDKSHEVYVDLINAERAA